MAISTDALWLISGCSAGPGRALAREALRRGHRSLASARDPATLAALRAEAPERMQSVARDITDAGAIATAIALARARDGVDVLVDNAGYGYLAAIEEGTDAVRPSGEDTSGNFRRSAVDQRLPPRDRRP
jgi:NADP-dependent 3-hydroxy acid dehydrogenase YdfG